MGIRPAGLSDSSSQELIDELWELAEACWSYNPEERPTAPMVLQALQAIFQKRAERRSQGLLEGTGYDTLDYGEGVSSAHQLESSQSPKKAERK